MVIAAPAARETAAESRMRAHSSRQCRRTAGRLPVSFIRSPAPGLRAPPPVATIKPATAFVAVSPAVRAKMAPLIAKVAKEFNLDAALLHAIVTVESGYNPEARSPAGAVGLMQLIPETAERFGVKDSTDPLDNLRGGARYLKFLLGMFKDNLELVLAAYNAGEGAVEKAGNKIPNYAETKAYVPNVLAQYSHYSNSLGGSAVPVGTTPVVNRDTQPLIR